MGCGGSKVDTRLYYDDKDENDYLKIGITHKELQKFAEVFSKFDVDGGAEISLNEFLHDVHLQFDAMTFKIFNCIDTHHDNSITFREFILFIWQFCTLAGEGIHNFAFDMYDEDHQGSLSKEELRRVLIKVHGKAHVESKLKAMFEIMDTGHSKDITRQEFMSHVKHFPAIVFPIFGIQNKLRQAILGESYWQGLEASSIEYKKHPQVIKMFEEAGLGKTSSVHKRRGGGTAGNDDIERINANTKTKHMGVVVKHGTLDRADSSGSAHMGSAHNMSSAHSAHNSASGSHSYSNPHSQAQQSYSLYNGQSPGRSGSSAPGSLMHGTTPRGHHLEGTHGHGHDQGGHGHLPSDSQGAAPGPGLGSSATAGHSPSHGSGGHGHGHGHSPPPVKTDSYHKKDHDHDHHHNHHDNNGGRRHSHSHSPDPHSSGHGHGHSPKHKH